MERALELIEGCLGSKQHADALIFLQVVRRGKGIEIITLLTLSGGY